MFCSGSEAFAYSQTQNKQQEDKPAVMAASMVEAKQTFPFKLYQTIEWASESEFSSALSWSQSGHALVVHDREKMVEHIIPKFFDHKKWRSFVSSVWRIWYRCLPTLPNGAYVITPFALLLPPYLWFQSIDPTTQPLGIQTWAPWSRF